MTTVRRLIARVIPGRNRHVTLPGQADPTPIFSALVATLGDPTSEDF